MSILNTFQECVITYGGGGGGTGGVGPQGVQGIQGIQGIAGTQGFVGFQGLAGAFSTISYTNTGGATGSFSFPYPSSATNITIYYFNNNNQVPYTVSLTDGVSTITNDNNGSSFSTLNTSGQRFGKDIMYFAKVDTTRYFVGSATQLQTGTISGSPLTITYASTSLNNFATGTTFCLFYF